MLDTLKALADPCRLRLVAVLLRGEFTVQELTTILKMGQSKVSWHLKTLTDAGVLVVKRQGTWSYYRADGPSPFFAAIKSAVEAGVETLPQRGEDLAAMAEVLEARRRRSREFFDRNAREWDDLVRTLLPVPPYRDRLLSLVPAGGTIVEIGIGTGGLIPAIAGKAAKVIGVDHSPAMLEEARHRLAEDGLGHIDLRLGEMTFLPMPDRGADCVILNMVLHHAATPSAVLAEVKRVLAPGGVLVLADMARHEREWARERLADQWLGFDQEELYAWLGAAGFANLYCERLEGDAGQESVLLVTAASLCT